MRLMIAALLSAAAMGPALVHATPSIPDPADPAANVPPITAPSVVDGYRPYSDADSPSWQQLNQAVQTKPPLNGMQHGAMHQPPGGNDDANHSNHAKAAQ